jgi:hypothetical protein
VAALRIHQLGVGGVYGVQLPLDAAFDRLLGAELASDIPVRLNDELVRRIRVYLEKMVVIGLFSRRAGLFIVLRSRHC